MSCAVRRDSFEWRHLGISLPPSQKWTQKNCSVAFIKWSRLSISFTELSYLLYSLSNAHTPSCLPFTKSFLKFQLIMVKNIFGRNWSRGKFLGISLKKIKQVLFPFRSLLIQTKILIRFLLAVMNWVISG